jgi:ribosomal protein S12 methylthiotransferase
MGRRSNESKTRALLSRMRERIPGLYLRTTFIVGFPGEDEKEFGVLRDFVGEFGFERLGVFSYSEEEGTPAAAFQDQVLPPVRAKRLQELMLVQQENAFRQGRARNGELVRVLIDEEGAVNGKAASQRGKNGVKYDFRGRSYGEAPEIDPSIHVRRRPKASTAAVPFGGARGDMGAFREIPVWKETDEKPLKTGHFVTVKITGNKDYDLLAEVVG